MIPKINKNFKFLYLNLLFLITPFVQFFQTNFDEISFYLSDLFKIFLFFLLIFIIFNFFFKKKLITILSFFYFCIFQFSLLNLIFNGLLSIILILLFLFLFSKFLIEKDKFINFLIIFLTINLIFFLSNFFQKPYKDLERFINIEREFIINKTTFSNPRNIYLIIPDEMVSVKYFDDEKNLINEYKKQFSNLGSTYIDGTLPSAKETIFNFLNILQMSDVKIDENFKDYHNLVKYFFQNPEKSRLLSLLEKNNYKLKLIGNPFIDCDSFDENICLISKKKKFTNIYVLDTFLLTTPFGYLRDYIKKIIKSKSDLLSIRYKNLFYENDAIGKFMNSSINISELNKPHFFIIHHLSPHDPFLYNEDCTFRNEVLKSDWDIFKDYSAGYKAAYICALKKVYDVINFIEKRDNNAIIIVQGDTGPVNDAFFNTFPKIKKESVELFSLVKSNNNCEKKLPKNINNIEIINFMIRCSFDL